LYQSPPLIKTSDSLAVDAISIMSLPPPRQHNEQQQAFLRQATILRKNLNAWEATICSAQGEDWPSMLGRLNAAFVSIGSLPFCLLSLPAYGTIRN